MLGKKMKFLFKMFTNKPPKEASKTHSNSEYKEKKIFSHLNRLKLNDNKDFLIIKTEMNNNIEQKSETLGNDSKKTQYSSNLNNLKIPIIKLKHDQTKFGIDNKEYKNIQSNFRNTNSITNFQMKNHKNKTSKNYHKYNTVSSSKRSIVRFQNIHKFEIDKIISFTNNTFYPKTPQKNKEINGIKNRTEIKRKRNNKFNSLNCFIDDYISKDNNESKKFKINFKDYFGDSDYEKLIEKEKTYLTEIKKIKLIYKNTNLMKALCDYLNLSFVKLKNEKNERMKIIKQEKEEIKKQMNYLKFLQNNSKYNLIPINKIFTNCKKNNMKLNFNNRKMFSFKNGYFSNNKIN